MAIILEGPDNSGKSTLAQAIVNAYGWPIMHAGKGGTPDDWHERALKDIDMAQRKVVMDRSFIISDTIYGPICRGERLFDPRPWMRKMQAVDSLDDTFVLVFCDAPDSVLADMSTHIVKPHDTQQHLDSVQRNKTALAYAYREFYKACSLFMNCVHINPRQDTEKFLDELPGLIKI